MRNIGAGTNSAADNEYIDPKKQAAKDRSLIPVKH
jgi:hypothetical protein